MSLWTSARTPLLYRHAKLTFLDSCDVRYLSSKHVQCAPLLLKKGKSENPPAVPSSGDPCITKYSFQWFVCHDVNSENASPMPSPRSAQSISHQATEVNGERRRRSQRLGVDDRHYLKGAIYEVGGVKAMPLSQVVACVQSHLRLTHPLLARDRGEGG